MKLGIEAGTRGAEHLDGVLVATELVNDLTLHEGWAAFDPREEHAHAAVRAQIGALPH